MKNRRIAAVRLQTSKCQESQEGREHLFALTDLTEIPSSPVGLTED